MNTKEIWRSVPSLPGLLASSAGRLMVVPRIAVMPLAQCHAQLRALLAMPTDERPRNVSTWCRRVPIEPSSGD